LAATTHPLAPSIEPGEAWVWCYSTTRSDGFLRRAAADGAVGRAGEASVWCYVDEVMPGDVK